MTASARAANERVAREKLVELARFAAKQQETHERIQRVADGLEPPRIGQPVDEASSAAMAKARATAQREERLKVLLAASHLPEKFVNASFDVLKLPEDVRPRYSQVLTKLRTLARRPVIIVLCGNRGPGKTHMAAALMNYFMRCLDRPARYVLAGHVIDSILSSRHHRGGVVGVKDAFRQPALLVIDEWLLRSRQEWAETELTSLIIERSQTSRLTLLLHNDSIPDFKQKTDARLLSRIQEGGAILQCSWRDLRAESEPPDDLFFDIEEQRLEPTSSTADSND